MARKRRRRSWCRVCGCHEREVGRISARGKCAGCGDARMVENLRQLRELRGPFAEEWLAQCRRAFGLELVERDAD